MATYSGKQFKAAVGLHTSNFGLATVGGTMYYMRLDEFNDIDFSAGSIQQLGKEQGRGLYVQQII